MSSTDSDGSTFLIDSDCIVEDGAASSCTSKSQKLKKKRMAMNKKPAVVDPLSAMIEDNVQPSTSGHQQQQLQPLSNPTSTKREVTSDPTSKHPPAIKKRKYVKRTKKLILGASSVLNESHVLQSVKMAFAHTPLIILPIYYNKSEMDRTGRTEFEYE